MAARFYLPFPIRYQLRSELSRAGHRRLMRIAGTEASPFCGERVRSPQFMKQRVTNWAKLFPLTQLGNGPLSDIPAGDKCHHLGCVGFQRVRLGKVCLAVFKGRALRFLLE